LAQLELLLLLVCQLLRVDFVLEQFLLCLFGFLLCLFGFLLGFRGTLTFLFCLCDLFLIFEGEFASKFFVCLDSPLLLRERV